MGNWRYWIYSRLLAKLMKKRIWNLLHFVLGNFNAWMFSISPILALLFGIGFIAYEGNEDRWKKDQAWKDLKPWLWGLGTYIVIWEIFK